MRIIPQRAAKGAALALLVAVCLAPFSTAQDEFTRPIYSYNTVTVRTAYATQFLRATPAQIEASGVTEEELPFGNGNKVTVARVLPSEIVLVFTGDEASMNSSTWATDTARVPYLQRFVYTSEAPRELVEAWAPLGNSTSTTAGQLSDLVDAVAGEEEVLRVVCVGEGAAGGGLATLCGPWAALQYPKANADVITFQAPWVGYNPQFAWSYEQLVVLHYHWPFAAPTPAVPGISAAADAVNPLITKDNVPGAVRLPNLPRYVPENLEEPGERSFDEIYSQLVPTNLPADYQLEESDCPVMLCKSRPLLKGSCLGFRNDTLLDSLPNVYVYDKRSGADAIVAWDETTRTAYFLFKYTEESRDWVTDAAGIQVEGFVNKIENLLPNDKKAKRREDSLTSLTGDVEVHQGFLNQFESLAISPRNEEADLLRASALLFNSTPPRRIAISGFSLGSALSELAGIWAAILWPGADILVANQGGPIPGNEEFKVLFEAAVGRAYKYNYRMDIVPSAAPLSWYKRNPASIWINGSTALLQDRPAWDFLDLSWNDHTCDTWQDPENADIFITGYVPRLYNITRPTPPAWIYNYTQLAPPGSGAVATASTASLALAATVAAAVLGVLA